MPIEELRFRPSPFRTRVPKTHPVHFLPQYTYIEKAHPASIPFERRKKSDFFPPTHPRVCESKGIFFHSEAGVGSAKKRWGRSVPIEPWMRLFPSSMLSTENVCGRHFELRRDACVPYVGVLYYWNVWVDSQPHDRWVFVGGFIEVDGGSAICDERRFCPVIFGHWLVNQEFFRIRFYQKYYFNNWTIFLMF